MQTKLLVKAMLKARSRRERFIYDAYFYAETPVSLNRVLDILHRIEFWPDFNDPVVENYVIDVLAGRAKPATQEVIIRKDGSEIV